jgi:isoquinoline 1-oxidoreductase alpha subunit
MDDKPLRSCTIPISEIGDAKITTIEGLQGREAKAVQDAWIARDVPQCGYCQSGQVMSAVALLQDNNKPSDTDIDLAMNGNICRCATYVRIRAAIHDAAKSLQG